MTADSSTITESATLISEYTFLGIRMKEECIRTITREQKEILSKADLYALRIEELEQEKSRLTEQLRYRNEDQAVEKSVNGDRIIVEEVHRQYRDKLRAVQVTFLQMILVYLGCWRFIDCHGLYLIRLKG